MQTAPITESTLPAVVKIIGFIVSWAASIYFLWVRKPPLVLTRNEFFPQVQRISIVMGSIFLALSWGYLANPRGLKTLAWIAVLATSFGICIFFLTIASLARSGSSNDRATSLLLAFLVYTFSISAGLTSAGVFLTVILGNPANAAAGISLVSESSFTAAITIKGETVSQHDQDIPFSVSSGQINFGCGETRPADVRFTVPEGGHLISSGAQWRNTDNARLPTAGAELVGSTLVAHGTISGLDFQNFAFVKNCPGGGHGEFVLYGVYRGTVAASEPKEVQLASTLPATGKDFVWVTLPTQLTIDTIEIVFRKQSSPEAVDTAQITKDEPNVESRNHLFRATLKDGRLGLANLK
jgi:hypothetical protein